MVSVSVGRSANVQIAAHLGAALVIAAGALLVSRRLRATV